MYIDLLICIPDLFFLYSLMTNVIFSPLFLCYCLILLYLSSTISLFVSLFHIPSFCMLFLPVPPSIIPVQLVVVSRIVQIKNTSTFYHHFC